MNQEKVKMKTLKREIRNIVKEILEDYLGEDSIYSATDRIADAIIKIRAFKTDEEQPEYNANLPVEWKILADQKIEEMKEIFPELDALNAFESALQVPANWNWYPAKTSEEKTWKDFRNFVLKLYTEDKECFTRYQTWRTQPYARGAMSNLAIKRNPENFPASWSDFLASSAMYGNKKQEQSLDDNGIPLSY